MEKNQRVIIFDTTLRDGEQAPGAAMTVDEKIAIAKLLDEMKVDVIEAGFAISSDGSFKAIQEICKIVKYSKVCSLARAKPEDITKAYEALKDSKTGFRIHTFISTSPIHMQFKLKMNKEQVLDAIRSSVSLAKSYTDDVEWSAEDATRTEKDFLFKSIEQAIKYGATTVNIPDTVGYSTPMDYYNLIKEIKNTVPNIDKAIISAHCHNDLGLATANSITALDAGVRQIECTINGIGERAGNASTEEIIMTFKTRPDILQYSINAESQLITRASKLVSSVTGFMVQKNKAIVGANAFAHESGIHQDGVLKNRQTYEIMTPESVGLDKNSIVLGKTSGRHAFKQKLSELGYDQIGDNRFEDLFAKFKDLCDKKKNIKEEDIISLVNEGQNNNNNFGIEINSINILTSASSKTIANITLTISGVKSIINSEEGDGPIDCIFKAINSVTKITDCQLVNYGVNSVTENTDAIARASVSLKRLDKTYNATADNTDTILASAIAYLRCLEKLASNEDINKIKSEFGTI